VRRVLPWLFASAVALAATRAAADDAAPAPAPPAASEPSTHWYGYQTLALDGLALFLTLPAVSSSASGGSQASLGVIATGAYVLGGPIVHLVHGRPWVALADLGIRLALPVVAAILGAAVGLTVPQQPCGDSSADRCPYLPDGLVNGFLVGGAVGIAGSVVIDATLLAREPAAPDAPTHVASSVLPVLALTPEGAGGARILGGAVVSF
jgi:hypothetical protein